jgi:uncharacterized paraquat-inducible protein A
MAEVAVYRGPHCPRCRAPVPEPWLTNGQVICPECGGDFEATLFNPVERKPGATRIIDEAPEGANLCANHARNAAVTSCQRCGLFICSLCEMNVGSGSYCPACFSKLQTEGTLGDAARRYRDYTLLARSAAILGVLMWFLSIPFGALTIYWAVKGRKQRRDMGKKTSMAVVLLILGVVEIIGGFALIGFIVYGLVKS